MIEFIDDMKAEAKCKAEKNRGKLTRKELADILDVTPPVVSTQLKKINKRITAGNRIVIPLDIAYQVIDNYVRYKS